MRSIWLMIPWMMVACGGEPAPAPAKPEPAKVEAPKVEAPKPALAELQIGQEAPDFSLADPDGNPIKLSNFRGKTVVLEWFNPDCPFVVQAHGPGGSLVDLPKTWIDKGVVWLAINSGAPGMEGHGAEQNKAAKAEYGMGYPILLDEKGEVGRAYGAKTTPHLYVIDAAGKLAYQGGLDNAPRGKVDGDGEKVNWTGDALTAITSGQAPALPQTKAWGCGVKYAKGG